MRPHRHVKKVKKHTKEEHSKIVEGILIAEAIAIDIELLVWDFIWGTCLLIYNMIFTLPIDILVVFIIGLVWMIVRDSVVYCTLELGSIIDAILEVVKLVVSALNTVASGLSSGISDVSEFFGGPSVSIPSVPIPTASEVLSPWYSKVVAIDTTCLEMDTWQKVIGAFAKVIFAPHTCPLLRYMYPTIWFPFLSLTLGWSSFPPAPYPEENCTEPAGEELCMWLNFYIVLFHLVIPLIIVRTFLNSYSLFIHRALNYLWALLELIIHLIERLVPSKQQQPTQ